MKKQQIKGLWWFPETPKERWVGKLRLAPDKTPRLKLTNPVSEGFSMPQQPSAVHGYDKKGNPITLLSPLCIKRSFSGAFNSLRYTAGHAIAGVELPSIAEFKASELTLYVQNLYGWVGTTGFQNTSLQHPETTMRYVRPSDRDFEIVKGLGVKIVTVFSSSWQAGEKKPV